MAGVSLDITALRVRKVGKERLEVTYMKFLVHRKNQ